MGLTGVVLEATFRATAIGSSRLLVDTDRAPDLDAVMALMDEGDARYDYSVAWIDLLARGRSMGRSVLDRGRFATVDELPRADRAGAVRLSGRRPGRRAARVPERDPQPPLGPGLQRAVVPQGAQAADRRPHDDPAVLPPARHDRHVVARLRAGGLLPVAVRRAARRGGDDAPHHRRAGGRRLRLAGQRAEALRRGRSRAPLVPRAGVDAVRGRARRATRRSPRCWTGSTSGSRPSAAGCTWPRTPACAPSCSR